MDVEVDSYDDHALHITEHTRFLLSSEFKKRKDVNALKARYVRHIEEHEKQKAKAQVRAEYEVKE